MNSKRDNRKEIHTKIYYSETVERQKQRTNLASSKREVSHHIQRILDEINNFSSEPQRSENTGMTYLKC